MLLILIAVSTFVMDSGASEMVDNYEWKTPEMSPENGCDQWTEGILTDEVTGEVYIVYQNREPYSQNWSDDSIVCAHLNPDTGTLDDRWAFNYSEDSSYVYLYFPRNRQYLVHDGHFYFLYFTNQDRRIHLRVDDMAEDKATWATDEFQLTILGVENGNLLFLMNDWGRDTIVLFTVSLSDFTTTRKDIMSYFFEVTGHKFLFRNRTVHALLWRQTRHGNDYSYDLMIDRYYVGLELRMGPTEVDLDTMDYWGTTHFDLDSEGYYHILYGDYTGENQGLHKVSSSGDVVTSVEIGHLMDDIDVNFSESWLDVLVNRTDYVYIIGRFIPNHFGNGVLCSLIFSSEYNEEVERDIIYSGPFSLNTAHNHFGMNGTGAIFTVWYSIEDDLYRVFFSFQIPPTPDLELSPSGFSFLEVGGATEPIHVTALVRNIGRASSRSHWIDISYSLDGYEPFVNVLDLRMDVPLDINETHAFEPTMALPQGSLMLRVKIHNVTPYENNKANNVLLGWFFVSNNNPPTIRVDLPADGSTVQDNIVVSGSTQDVDIGGEVTTIITGLPTLTISFEGVGPWNRTVDLGDIPSGVYTLSFRAYDGQHFSEVIYRMVRVARADDRLRMASLYPIGDVTLIEGGEQAFFFNATDPLMNDLDYRWRMDYGTWKEGDSLFLFKAGEVGDFRLGVEVSNGFTNLSHEWNVTVIELIMPRIGEVNPAGPEITMRKREGLEFSVEIVNPHEQPYSIIWTLDGEVFPGNAVHTRSLVFALSGRHTLSARLFTSSTQEAVSWNISVPNQAPLVESWSPENSTVVIEQEQEMVFEVKVTDGDGDGLQYLWSNGDLRVPGQDSPSCIIVLSAASETAYSIRVAITDGEATTVHEWRVQPVLSEQTSEPPEDVPPWRTVSAGLLIFLVVLGAIGLSYLYIRSKGGSS